MAVQSSQSSYVEMGQNDINNGRISGGLDDYCKMDSAQLMKQWMDMNAQMFESMKDAGRETSQNSQQQLFLLTFSILMTLVAFFFIYQVRRLTSIIVFYGPKCFCIFLKAEKEYPRQDNHDIESYDHVATKNSKEEITIQLSENRHSRGMQKRKGYHHNSEDDMSYLLDNCQQEGGKDDDHQYYQSKQKYQSKKQFRQQKQKSKSTVIINNQFNQNNNGKLFSNQSSSKNALLSKSGRFKEDRQREGQYRRSHSRQRQGLPQNQQGTPSRKHGHRSSMSKNSTDHCIYYHKNRAFGVLLEEVTERTIESDATSFKCIKDDVTLKGSIENSCLTNSVINKSMSAHSDPSYDDLFDNSDHDADQSSSNLLSFNLIF